MYFLNDANSANFGRGKDRKPRKKRSALKTAGMIAGGVATVGAVGLGGRALLKSRIARKAARKAVNNSPSKPVNLPVKASPTPVNKPAFREVDSPWDNSPPVNKRPRRTNISNSDASDLDNAIKSPLLLQSSGSRAGGKKAANTAKVERRRLLLKEETNKLKSSQRELRSERSEVGDIKAFVKNKKSGQNAISLSDRKRIKNLSTRNRADAYRGRNEARTNLKKRVNSLKAQSSYSSIYTDLVLFARGKDKKPRKRKLKNNKIIDTKSPAYQMLGGNRYARQLAKNKNNKLDYTTAQRYISDVGNTYNSRNPNGELAKVNKRYSSYF